MAGVWPLLLQLPIIFGLLDVVYKPLKHLLHIPAATVSALLDKAAELLGTTVEAMGSTAQLKVVEMFSDPAYAEALGAVAGAEGTEAILSLNMNFLGINLSHVPSLALNLLLLVPLFAGLSALVMCWIQNKINVLQIEQSKLSQWSMTIFMIAFSTYFAFLVPAGVGMYWGWGNLFAIAVMYLVNLVYDPKKYINYKVLAEMKEQVAHDRAEQKRCRKLAKKYYKQFCRVENLESMKLMFYAEGSGYYKYFSFGIYSYASRVHCRFWRAVGGCSGGECAFGYTGKRNAIPLRNRPRLGLYTFFRKGFYDSCRCIR
jgi:YidC/Oxa1 family membrane protein insertase